MVDGDGAEMAWWIDGGGDKVRERADGVVGWSLAATDYGKVQCDRVAANSLACFFIWTSLLTFKRHDARVRMEC